MMTEVVLCLVIVLFAGPLLLFLWIRLGALMIGIATGKRRKD